MKPPLAACLLPFLLFATAIATAQSSSEEIFGMQLRENPGGVRVLKVNPRSWAAQAAIQPEDVIEKVNGTSVANTSACFFAIANAVDTSSGREIRLTIERRGRRVSAVLHPTSWESGFMPRPPVPWPRTFRDYQILPDTISPDHRYAFIYPKRSRLYELKTYRLYLARLEPWQILAKVPLGYSNLAGNVKCYYAANWAKDSSAAVFIAGSRWGPDRVTLLTLHHDRVSRTRSLTALVRAQVLPSFRRSRAPVYNDYYGFIFDSEDRQEIVDYETVTESGWDLDGAGHVVIDCTCTTDPKEIAAHSWTVHFHGVWDIARDRFTRKSITQLAGSVTE